MPGISEDKLDDLLYFFQAKALAEAFGHTEAAIKEEGDSPEDYIGPNLHVVAAWWRLVFPETRFRACNQSPKEAQQFAESTWEELLEVNLTHKQILSPLPLMIT